MAPVTAPWHSRDAARSIDINRIFRRYTYTVWHMAIIKVAVAAVAMIAGAYLSSFVLDTLWLFIAIWAITAGYILWLTYKNNSPTER